MNRKSILFLSVVCLGLITFTFSATATYSNVDSELLPNTQFGGGGDREPSEEPGEGGY